MTRQEVMELQKKAAIEAFVGENIYEYTELKLGLDYRVALEENRLTSYIKNLISESKYFGLQSKGRDEIELVNQLICSRLIECRLLEKWAGKVKLNGTDKDKLITEFSTYLPDLKESCYDTSDYYYEVISTFNNTFVLNHTLYVREGKINYLREFSKTHNVYIVAVDVLAQMYCFIPVTPDFDTNTNVKKSSSYGYHIDLKDAEWFSLYESDFIVDV